MYSSNFNSSSNITPRSFSWFHKINYIFRYLILITNDSHQCYPIILRRLVSGVLEMNQGVMRKNLDSAQYLVCPPFAAKTARQRRLILQISFLMICNGILTHSASKARSRSRMLLTYGALSPDDLSGPNKCLMGERSNDLAGHCNTLTFWMRKMFWVHLAVCGRALSCCKILTLCFCKYGTTGSIIPSRQRNANVGTTRFQSNSV